MDESYFMLDRTLFPDDETDLLTIKQAIHRLHPYKGKFIPQLVEYFLDDHTDEFKREVFFQKGDVVLDPFSGSGTTLVQENELSLHDVGVEFPLSGLYRQTFK